jgi:hypothetical protein
LLLPKYWLVALLADIEDLDFKDWLLRKTDTTSPERESDYSSWFSDKLIQESLQPLSGRLHKAGAAEEKKAALLEGQSAMVLYSTLIYYLYPSQPSMRRQLDSNPELKRNFLKLKGWFDSNGGPKIAGDYYHKLVKGASSREPW